MSRMPSSFFMRERPVIATKESLKDITSIKWNKEVIAGMVNKKLASQEAFMAVLSMDDDK